MSSQNDKPKQVICIGDSITYGGSSYDWVSGLILKNKQLIFHNKGINGATSPQILANIDQIFQPNPDFIFLLIGTNDIIATENETMQYYIYSRVAPRNTIFSIESFEKSLNEIIKMLKLKCTQNTKIAVFSIPPLGEKLDDPIQEKIKNYNNVIKIAVQNENIEYLPLNEKLTSLIETYQNSNNVKHFDFKNNTMFSIIKNNTYNVIRYFFGTSRDTMGHEKGCAVLFDYIHLNETGGNVLMELAQQYLDKCISQQT